MNAVLQDQPLPARLVPWQRPPSTTLLRCLLLAGLLHLWLVVWLGSAPGGTAQPGQGVWGAINVTLAGRPSVGTATPALAAAPSSAAPGVAPAPRWGGAVREVQPLPDSEPGAAQLGLPAERRPDAMAQAPPAPPADLPADLPPTPAIMPTAADAVAPAAVPAPVPVPVPGPAPPAILASPQRQLASPLSLPSQRTAVSPLATSAAPPALQELAVPPTPGDAPPVLRQLQPAAAATGRVAEPALAATPQPLQSLQLQAVPGAVLPAVGSAASDADTRAGPDLASPAAAPASAPPRLNLQLARPRGGELSRHDSRGVLPVLPRPPDRDEKLAREIEKAARSDCRSAYSALGPLAVIPLAVDAVRKDGACKW